MKIKETAIFIFAFEGPDTKVEAYKELQKFLRQNGWLDSNLGRIAPLELYKTENDAVCHVTLADDESTNDFSDQIDDLFECLRDTENIKWVKIKFNNNTKKIVINEADKYIKYQTIRLSEVKDGDEIIVYKK